MTSVTNSLNKANRKSRGGAVFRALALSTLLAGTACQTSGPIDRDNKIAIGTIAGAVLGGFAGYQLIGSGNGQLIGLALGAAAGSFGGYYLADHLTRLDKRTMAEAEYEGLTDTPSGESVSWDNPDSGNSGEIRLERTFLSEKGQICRDYVSVVNVDGETSETPLRACQNAAGVWVRA